eukprot:CAMPEP_0206183530 /NCGR_PEP_ID=MMETSP0166-20121206/693_1 /ASSEMBLY_ACC=CAM_ASM_000260 /TAXON_ID=95228 /ORGANISM="Vannella robusta, Strain DIVA3 518/3/11/1/6" /LENGTH=377 /DNA_ID=CAMNT_0053598403 /DNA_START=493 /DNA_END=1626 /DNA_ORIENTATION=-
MKEFTLSECVDTIVNPDLKQYAKPLSYHYRSAQFSINLICAARAGEKLLGVMCCGLKDVLIGGKKSTISIGMDGRIIRNARNKGVMKLLSTYTAANIATRHRVIGMLGCSSPKTLPSAHILGVEEEKKANQNRQRVDLLDEETMLRIGRKCEKVQKLTRRESTLLFEEQFMHNTELYPLDLEENITGNSLFKGFYVLENDDGSCRVGAAIWQNSLIYRILNVGEEVPWPANGMENREGYNALFGMFAEGNLDECDKLFSVLISHLSYITTTEPARHNIEGATRYTIVTEQDRCAPGVCPKYLLSCCQYSWKLSTFFDEWPIHWDDILVAFNPFEKGRTYHNEDIPFFVDPRDLGNALYSPEKRTLAELKKESPHSSL